MPARRGQAVGGDAERARGRAHPSVAMQWLAVAVLAAAPQPRAAFPRRVAVAGACLLPFAAFADLPIAAYCIPGLTADRCRGVFWETGKLYKQEIDTGAVVSEAEYRLALAAIIAVRKSLADQQRNTPAQLGEVAAAARAYLRKNGAIICRALDEETRYDCEFQLKEALAALDEVDRDALYNREVGVAPGFGSTSLLLDFALKSLDTFIGALPQKPTAVF